MNTMFGSWLDEYGAGGYTPIFIFLVGLALFGAAIALIISRMSKKSQNTLS